MTEKPSALSTQIANPSQTIFPSTQATPIQDVPHKVEPTVEGEEPYTIKCICNFSDDDGNTIYCETCDTWQHIECFYPNNVEEAYREDFAHSCHDCKPRQLDHQQAIERQRSRLRGVVEETTTNPKPKRPPSKNHKKKPKPTELQLNGHAPPTEASNKHSISHDHPPPAKKAKNTHKSSHSVSSHPAKRSPSYGTTRANHHGHPPSPATTPPELPPDFELHNYSPGFLSLYNDQDLQIVHTNSYANLTIPNTMSLWVREPQRVLNDSAYEYKEVFRDLPADIETRKQSLRMESKKIPLDSDTVARVQYLTTPTAVEKDIPLMELNGHIGFQTDYCDDPDHQWAAMSAPLPFVFFHPMLPLYIDTRREGSPARYVRRSCKPNAALDTFLSGGSEYHFWLVSDRPIAANEQITIPWDFRYPKGKQEHIVRLLGLDDDEPSRPEEQAVDATEYSTVSEWVHRLLSEYGGCACDLGSNCAFARFHRINFGKIQARPNPPKKKTRKPKTHAISPTSTGHATNSRAASEGHMDDGAENDGRSTDDSARSKPPSRDMTPARQGSFDTLGILTEPTDRDKRKVAMVEDSFRRLEQQPPRKKKRISDGTGTPGSKPKSRHSTSHATGISNGVTYVDAGTSRSKSGSPSSAVSPSTAHAFGPSMSRPDSIAVVSRRTSASPRDNYCDAAVQTDPVEGEWYSESGPTPKPRRRIVSLSKKLLDNRHRVRLDEEEQRKRRTQDASVVPMDLDPTPEQRVGLASPVMNVDPDKQSILAASVDTAMPDAPVVSPSGSTPSTLATSSLTSPVKVELRVQMPPVPAFSTTTSVLSTVTTPLSASSIVQSPFATNPPNPFGPSSFNNVAANPSPVKKKLSLSDYTKSRKAAAGRPSVGTSLKTSSSNVDEPKSATSAEGAGAAESPTTEKSSDGLANAPSLTTATTNGSV